MARKFKVVFNPENCKGCELCIAVCPKHVIGMSKHVNALGYFTACAERPEDCIGCIGCGLICPDGAIEVFEEV